LEKDSETFPSFLSKVPFIYILKFLDFITCNDEVNKHVVEKEKIKIGDEREREKSNMQMVEEGQKIKYVITTNLFSHESVTF
jgi:hypothetical protein